MRTKIPELKIEWTATVGTKGQIVIPKWIRKRFGLTSGTDIVILSVCTTTIIIKSENLNKMINHFQRMAQIFSKKIEK